MVDRPTRWAALLGTALLLLLVAVPAVAQGQPMSPAQAATDFDRFWGDIGKHYCYFGKKHIDWTQVRRLYLPRAREVSSRLDLLHLLEQVIAELYDDHATMGADAPGSPRIVPSRTDLWGAWHNGKAILEAVRPNSAAAAAGLEAGDEVVAVNNESAETAVCAALPRALTAADPAARDWALRRVLAGRRGELRRITVRRGQQTRTVVELRDTSTAEAEGPLESRTVARGTGYIRLHNSLGDTGTVAAFDAALDALRNTRSLILDLRDTPGGGDSAVAEPILGRFIHRRAGYQKFIIPHGGRLGGERSFTEKVSPRGPFTYDGKLVVLVDRWTASMGEGMAVGLSGMGRATVVGTPMAGLNGAVHGHKLPRSGIPYSFPAERIYAMDGTPRETFRPNIAVDLTSADAAHSDPILQCGIAIAEGATKCAP